MCWNSKWHNDHNYFAISGHSASQKYVTSPSVASKSNQNLLIKSHQNHHNHFVTTWSASSGETWKGRWRSWTCWRARSCCSCTRRMTTGGARCASSLNSKSLIPQREGSNRKRQFKTGIFFWQFILEWVEIDRAVVDFRNWPLQLGGIVPSPIPAMIIFYWSLPSNCKLLTVIASLGDQRSFSQI